MNSKLSSLIKENKHKLLWGVYIIFIISISLLYYSNLQATKQKLFSDSIQKEIIVSVIYFFYCFLTAGVLAILIKVIILNKKLEIYKKFFFIALVIGVTNMVMIPFINGADEYEHFCRAYEISEGNFITKIEDGNIGSILPSSIKEVEISTRSNVKYIDLEEVISKELDKDVVEKYKNDYVNISLYSPIQYIPQVIGISIAKFLNLNLYFVGMFGRLFGFLFWIIVTTYAIKIIPRKKVFFSIALLSPICIGYATTLSGDTMLNSVVVLFLAYLYKFRNEKKILLKKDYIILLILSCIIALCKLVYIPIVLLIFTLPKECLKEKKRKI